MQDVAEELHVLLVVLDDEDPFARHDHALLAGSVKTNVLPCPELALDPDPAAVQLDEPLREREPEPRPLALFDPRSPCMELLEHRSWSSGAIPGPVSETETLTSPLTRAVDTSTAPPAGVNFTAFESRLKTTCWIRRSSPSTMSASGSVATATLTLVVARSLPHHDHPAFERLPQRERRHLELHPAGLDLGQVEHVVDEGEQVAARGEDVVEVLLLLLVDVAEHPIPQHLREAEDRVERCSQLVRHVREELRLVLAGRFELRVQAAELVVHPVDVGGKGTQLVAVHDVDVPGEIARRDRGQARSDPLDRADQRPREGDPQHEREDEGRRRNTDEQIPRALVGGLVLGDQFVGLRPPGNGEHGGALIEVAGKLLSLTAHHHGGLARGLAVLEFDDLHHQRRQLIRRHPDGGQVIRVLRRGREPEPVDGDLRADPVDGVGDGLVDDQGAFGGSGSRITPGPDLVKVPGGVLREERSNVPGIALELPVGEGSLLECLEALDPVVRLSEDALAQQADGDQQDGRAHDHDEELGVDLDGKPAHGLSEGIGAPGQRPSLLVHGSASPRPSLRCARVRHGLRGSARSIRPPGW